MTCSRSGGQYASALHRWQRLRRVVASGPIHSPFDTSMPQTAFSSPVVRTPCARPRFDRQTQWTCLLKSAPLVAMTKGSIIHEDVFTDKHPWRRVGLHSVIAVERPWKDSNLQPFAPEANALSLALQGPD